jgi:N-methylhydantoinase A
MVDFDLQGVLPTQIYDSGRLEAGMRFTGPAIVEDPGMTLVVHPGDEVWVDPYGNYRIEVRQDLIF